MGATIYQAGTYEERFNELLNELKQREDVTILRSRLRSNYALIALRINEMPTVAVVKYGKAGYREITERIYFEDDGPAYYDAPLVYLEETEADGKDAIALEWRKAVRDYNKEQSAIKALKLKEGMRVQYGDYSLEYTGKPNRWINLATGGHVRTSPRQSKEIKRILVQARQGE